MREPTTDTSKFIFNNEGYRKWLRKSYVGMYKYQEPIPKTPTEDGQLHEGMKLHQRCQSQVESGMPRKNLLGNSKFNGKNFAR